MDAKDELLHQLAKSSQIGRMSVSDLAKLIADALKEERKFYERRFQHLQRQISMLRSNDRARAARELRDNATAEDTNDD